MRRATPGHQAIVELAPIAFLAVMLLGFGIASPRFLTLVNILGILVQSSWLIIVALGVNFVILTAGIDLSIGAVMYLAAFVGSVGQTPLWGIFGAAILIGALFGAINGTLSVGLRLPSFIVTLGTVYVGRGLGLYMSSTQMVHASLSLTDWARGKIAGLPMPIVLAGTALLVAWIIQTRTAFGTYVRAIGADAPGARRAGIPDRAVVIGAFSLSGAFAGLGGILSFSQISAVSPAFGEGNEFLAIAAAVLGGTSLFGGRGTVFGPVMGAVLIMAVQNGLVIMNANPYVYPVVNGAVIFLAALVDVSRAKFALRRRVGSTISG